MSQSSPPNTCPDCGGTLRPIQLFGRGPANPLSGAATDTVVAYYTEAGAERSTWLAMFQEAGRVHASMCAGCHRIFLYGSPG
jgi:hypothetical protein